METTAYFRNQVRRKRPYLKEEWILETMTNPDHKEAQLDGRVKYWKFVPELEKHLRVVTLADGETVHNAFPDRGFRPPQ